ncbi:hypothetical protein ACOMHN_059585 [Nucella lapillus]
MPASMMVSQRPHLGGPTPTTSQHRKSPTRKVTFSPHPRSSRPPPSYSTTSSPSLLISSIFPPPPHPSSPTSPRRVSSSSEDVLQSKSWGGAFWTKSVSSRASSALSGTHGSHSATSPRTRSAAGSRSGFVRTPLRRGSSSPGFGQPASRHGRSPSRNSTPTFQQESVSSVRASPTYTSRRSTTTPANSYSSSYSSSAHIQLQQRPKTSSSVPFYSRRLGAELYPRLERSDLDRERAMFRSGSVILERLLAESARSQSARWRSMGSGWGSGGGGGGGGDGRDSFCREALAESHLNNADVARVFHVVPQRVQSAKGGVRGRGLGVSLTLHQVSQARCHRRQLMPSTTTTTSGNNNNNNIIDNKNRHNDINKKDADDSDRLTSTSNYTDNTSSTSSISSISSNNNVSLNDGQAEPANPGNNKTLFPTKEDKDTAPKNGRNDGDDNDGGELNTSAATTSRKENDVRASREDNDVRTDTSAKRSGKKTESPLTKTTTYITTTIPPDRDDEDPKHEDSTETRRVPNAEAKGSLTPGRSPVIPHQRTRGVGNLDHSIEWIKESQLKQRESVTILSRQLQSMISLPGSEQGLEAAATTSGEALERQQSLSILFPTVGGETSTLTNLPCERKVAVVEEEEEKEEEEEEEEEGGIEGGGEGKGVVEISERVRCLKKMQCEVLGPYSCADCTKLRKHERQHQQQTALYPDLLVDPRALVAPDRLRKLTATLPPNLTSQHHTLQCGCALNMHPDFLFPVIFTDHDIQSRLKMARASAKNPREGQVRFSSSLLDSNMSSLPDRDQLLSAGGTRRSRSSRRRIKKKKEDAQVLVLSKDGEKEDHEEEGPTAVDMKVTVRYSTPPTPVEQTVRYSTPPTPVEQTVRYSTPPTPVEQTVRYSTPPTPVEQRAVFLTN